MKVQLICLLVQLTAVVQGYIVRTSEPIQDKVPQLNLEQQTEQKPIELLTKLTLQMQQVFGNFADGTYSVDGQIIDAMKKLLLMFAKCLEQLQEKVENGAIATEEFLAKLEFAINNLDSEVNELNKNFYNFLQKHELRNAANGLIDALINYFGPDTLDIFRDSLRDESWMKQKNNGGARFAFAELLLVDQLEEISQGVRNTSGLANALEHDITEVTDLLKTITAGLNEASNTNGTPEVETQTAENLIQKQQQRRLIDLLLKKIVRKETD